MILASLAGCAGVPFERPARVPMGGADPAAVARAFGERTPRRFSLVATILFRYNWLRKMSAIGCIDVDATRREFTVACFNPLGVKLFEIASAGNEVVRRDVFPALAEKGDVAGAVARDIGRVYFDLLPPAGAIPRNHPRKIEFRAPAEGGEVRHVFAGPSGDLTEKRWYDEKGSLVWRVSYYEYRDERAGRIPRGVVLDNFKHGYRLVVKVKEIAENAEN